MAGAGGGRDDDVVVVGFGGNNGSPNRRAAPMLKADERTTKPYPAVDGESSCSTDASQKVRRLSSAWKISFYILDTANMPTTFC